MGKIAMLRELGLPDPDSTLSRGHQHVAANDALKRVLEPLLPGDSWGQGQFAYWLLDHDTTATPPDEDRLAAAASDLLVPEEFLRELEELLKEKGQLIFYGPPGHREDLPRRPVRCRAPARRRSGGCWCSSTRRCPTRTSSRATGRRSTSASRCTTSCGRVRWR